MTPELLTLFDAVDAVARHSDPATSHQAAASMDRPTLSEQRRQVLAAALEVDRRTGGRGATAYEVTGSLSRYGKAPQMNVVARRLRDLYELGLVELAVVDGEPVARPGGSGRAMQAWTPTSDGRRALS